MSLQQLSKDRGSVPALSEIASLLLYAADRLSKLNEATGGGGGDAYSRLRQHSVSIRNIAENLDIVAACRLTGVSIVGKDFRAVDPFPSADSGESDGHPATSNSTWIANEYR